MITLPPKIDNKISEILSKDISNNWLQSAVTLSHKYRLERPEKKQSYINDQNDALGYLAVRAPSTYSQIYGAISSIKELNPNWKPESILDIGSGPGTAIWAAVEIFPSIKTGIAIEKDRYFSGLGKTILSQIPEIKIDWQEADLQNPSDVSGKFDLVIIANVLNEVDEMTGKRIIELAQSHCNGILIITEPGTPYGYEAIKHSSTLMNSQPYRLIAPYLDNTFVDSLEINFVERIKRPEFQKRVRHLQRKNDNQDKSKILPPSDWEESKFYYLAYSNLDTEITPHVRLIDNPKPLKPFVELKVLTGLGIKIERVFKKDRENYKRAKKLKWGDIITSNFEKQML